MSQNDLIRKIKLSLNFYDVPVWLTIVIHIFSNMSRNKDNQTMKYDQLIEYNMRNIIIEK